MLAQHSFFETLIHVVVEVTEFHGAGVTLVFILLATRVDGRAESRFQFWKSQRRT